MKSLGNVATMTPRQENGASEVTSSADDVMKMEEKQNSTPVPRLGNQKNGKPSIPATPGKAPLEITNAIRRRRETNDLDYWHTLPPAPPQSQPPQQQPSTPAGSTPKPFYRAVLRGYGDNATTLCTLSSIVDAVNEKEYNMVIRKQNGHLSNGYHFNGNGNLIQNKNFSVVRAEDMGLSINGLSITEIKASKTQSTNLTSSNTSPRGNGWKGHSSASFVKQRRLSGSYNNNNHSNNNNDTNNGKACNTNDRNNINSDHIITKNGKLANTNTSATNLQPMQSNNVKTGQRSPRLCLTNRQSNNNTNNNDLVDSKRPLFYSENDRKDSNTIPNNNNNNNNSNNDKTTYIQSPNKHFLPRQASLPLTSNETKPLMTSDNYSKNNVNNSKVFSIHRDTTIAKRKFSNELDNYKRLSKQDSLPNNSTPSSSSSCLQFADSIISALTVDLNKMYSICQTKVRYAEFIENSQPHRLDAMTNQMKPALMSIDDSEDQSRHKLTLKELRNINNNNDNNIAINNQCLSKNSKEFASLTSPPPAPASSPSSLSPASNTLKQSNASSAIKNTVPSRLAPLATKTNKYSTIRDITVLDTDYKTTAAYQEGFDKDSPRVRTRPILKTSKTDIDTNLPMFRATDEKTDSNNNTSLASNRLVRFKVNHEVREFAPSEPVRFH